MNNDFDSYGGMEEEEYFRMLGLVQKKHSANFPFRRGLGLACLIAAVVYSIAYLIGGMP